MRLQKLARFVRRAAPVGAGVLLAALVMRHVWRDEYVWSAPTFYALPLPLHVAGWMVLGLIWWKVNRRLAWMCLAGVIFSAVLWWMNTTKLRGDATAGAGDGPRVLFWNIGHTNKVPAALHELIKQLEPDVIGLAEAENLETGGFAELMKEHPGFRAVQLPQGVACLAKGHFSTPVSDELARRVSVSVCTVVLSRIPGEWRLCMTDLPPMPPLPRTDYLDRIRREAGAGPRTIVMADFNTPLDAAGFDAWREDYYHGFADCAAWSGPLETWACGLPLLAIDHIWMSKDYAPRAAQKAPRWLQDHSWLFVEWAPAAR